MLTSALRIDRDDQSPTVIINNETNSRFTNHLIGLCEASVAQSLLPPLVLCDDFLAPL